MHKIGCALIQDMRGARQSLPAGFKRRDPGPTSHLTLIMLALSRPANREDSDKVGSDLMMIIVLLSLLEK